MRKDSLLDDLVADLKPVHRRSAKSDTLLAASLCGAQLVLFLLSGMARPDMSLAMSLPSFWWKLTSTGLLAVAGTVTAILSFDPRFSPRFGLSWLVIIAVTSIVIGGVIGIFNSGPGLLPTRLEWREGVQCVGKIVSLSLPALTGVGLLMRRGAPTDRDGTAWAVGVAAAAHQWWSANIFTLASDMFPRRALGTVVGIGGFAGAMGGVLFQRMTGAVLQSNGHDYTPIFVVCGLAYVSALLIIHLLVPRVQQVNLDAAHSV